MASCEYMDEAEAANRFRRLIEPLHDRVLAFSRSLCRSSSDGDDLFQEAMLRAYTKLGALRDDAAFRGWLYRIVITVHRSRARRAFWRRLTPFAEHDHGHDDDDVSSHADDYRTSGWTPDAVEATCAHGALMLGLIGGASAAIIVGSIVVARRPPRSTRWWIPAGVVLGTATLLVGFRVDVGPHAYALLRLPSVPLRIALTASSTLAVFLVIGGWVLFARRRDSLAASLRSARSAISVVSHGIGDELER